MRLRTDAGRACTKLGLLAVSLLCSIAPAKAEYRLDAGDVIEISVAGVPELRQRVTVQLDGTISFPILGTLAVAGLPPSEVQAKIQATLPTRLHRRRMPDGREIGRAHV